MSTRIVSSVLLAALLASSPAQGQTAERTPPPRAEAFVDRVSGLSLEQAIARAIEQAPGLRAMRSQVDAARGMRTQASLRANPSLSFERRDEPAGTDNQTMVTVQWPLELFRRDPRMAVADRDVEAAALAVADRERLLAGDVRMRYGEVLAAVRDLALLEELVATTRREHALLRARVDEGASPPLERDLLEVEVHRLEADHLTQVGRVEAALFELKGALGMSADAPLRVRDILEELVQPEAVAAPLASDADAVAGRTDVREAAARADAAAARIERAQAEGRVDVSLFGSYMRMDAGFPQRGFAATGSLDRIRGVFHYVSGGAMITVPLLDRNQGEVAAARAERSGAAAAYDAVRLAAGAEVAAARARDARARQALSRFTTGAQTLARRNLEVVRQSYELGRVTVFDVLAEQRRYLDVERAYTGALRTAYDARTALELALGEVR